MQRRQFIQHTTLGTLAAMTMPTDFMGMKKVPHTVSLQLYSVRADMTKDPVGTVKKLSQFGYKDCEHAGYNAETRKFYGYAPAEWKKILADLGMTMKSGHTVFGTNHYNMETKQLTDLWKTTVEDSVKAGQHYIISPSLNLSFRKDFDQLKKFMDGFNISGAYCKSQGIKYGYHNHDFEFSIKLTSKRIMDIIMESTDPNLVAQQIDIGNMYNGGGRPMELLKQYPGRFELMHVKDEIKTTNKEGLEHYESTILGKGIVGVKDVLKYARKKGGTHYLIIEQEAYQNLTPLESVKEDLAMMEKWGY